MCARAVLGLDAREKRQGEYYACVRSDSRVRGCHCTSVSARNSYIVYIHTEHCIYIASCTSHVNTYHRTRSNQHSCELIALARTNQCRAHAITSRSPTMHQTNNVAAFARSQSAVFRSADELKRIAQNSDDRVSPLQRGSTPIVCAAASMVSLRLTPTPHGSWNCFRLCEVLTMTISCRLQLSQPWHGSVALGWTKCRLRLRTYQHWRALHDRLVVVVGHAELLELLGCRGR